MKRMTEMDEMKGNISLAWTSWASILSWLVTQDIWQMISTSMAVVGGVFACYYYYQAARKARAERIEIEDRKRVPK